MSAWKYAMFEDRNKRRFPVIFPAEISHADMAEAVQHAVRMSEVKAKLQDYSNPEPVSAGFIATVTVDRVGGSSETLGMLGKPHDREIIHRYPLTRGMP